LKDVSEKEVLAELKRVFEDKDIEKIAQNIKYDILILKNLNIDVRGELFDTMIASYLLDPSRSRHNLNDISMEHLGRVKKSIDELLGKGKNVLTMDKVDVEKVCAYCCEDSDLVMSLKDTLLEKMSKKECIDLFYNIEMPLVRVLIDMEFYGVNIDKEYLNKLSLDMGREIKKLEKKIYDIAGETFNINSSKQMQVLLFEKLKMPIIKKTKTGSSTDEGVLKVLAQKHELPNVILSYRRLAKLKSTYVDSLPELINSRTGRIHTSFNQAVTATGRLSSSDPNLQNIPIKTDEGKKIRKAFVVGKKNHLILSADYSQIELRILAHFSNDPNLKEAFMKGKDIHSFTASLVNDIKEKDVTPQMRRDAKIANFGIIYGLSAYGLSRDLGIDVHSAQKFIDAYFERYSKIKTYLHDTVEDARENGYVSTIMGRRRYIPDIKSSNISARNFAERIAVNAPLQGSAADIIKLAMINIRKYLDEKNAKMILQVHDELVFEVKDSELKKIAKKIKSDMENVVKLKVPLEVDVEAGKNWLETKEVKI
jgi:DNA polymerase I